MLMPRWASTELQAREGKAIADRSVLFFFFTISTIIEYQK